MAKLVEKVAAETLYTFQFTEGELKALENVTGSTATDEYVGGKEHGLSLYLAFYDAARK